jgi:hypothetical protein
LAKLVKLDINISVVSSYGISANFHQLIILTPKLTNMKIFYKIAALVVIAAIITTTLTSGIRKEYDGGYRNLVDELYEQAVKQNDNLESIEDDIEKFYKNRNEALEKYNSFTAYNNRYYTDARSKAATITDAATQQKANEVINKSETAYKSKLANWQATIATLNANEKELTNLHALLKIITTQPMIEKYQNDALPDNTKLREANGELQKVIEKIKAITK